MTVNTRASITAPLPWAVFEKPPAFIPADINISLMLFILSYLFCQYVQIIFYKALNKPLYFCILTILGKHAVI